MRTSKTFKKAIAYVCAMALIVVGITYSPAKTSATTEWISVTDVPSGAWGGKKDMYQLGTTTDTSADGKWYLEVSQNEWGNWNGRYKNADSIEGFTFNNQTYNNAGGVFLWSTELKSEFGLTAGATYNMSVTISYTGINAAQHNYVLTEGGNTNMNISRTVVAGASEETYTAQVVPSAQDFVLRISYTSSGYNTAEVGTFEVTDVTFTPVAVETTTAAGNTCAQSTWTFAEENGWQYYVANADSTYENGDTLANGLTINYGTYCGWEGTCQARTPITTVTEGNACTGSITVSNASQYNMENVSAGVYAYDSSTGEYSWYANATEGTQTVAAGGSTTFNFSYTAPATGKVVYVACTNYTPGAAIGFTATHNESAAEPTTAEETTAEVTTTEETTTAAGNTCAQSTWTFAEENGWQYFVANADSTYEDGDTLANGLTINYGTYCDWEHTCQARTPIITVTEGNACTGSITVSNASEYTMSTVAASVYAYDSSTGEYTWYANATEGTQAVAAGGSTTFNFSYTAPATGKVVYIADTSYTPGAAIGFAATHSETAAETTTEEETTVEETTVAGNTCVQSTWTFAEENGWQYFVANADSTYEDGDTLANGLTINYGTYCDWEHTCQARTPIITVTEGNACTGSITVSNASEYTMSTVAASVYAYDSSTGEYTWYANATEGTQAVAAGGSTTFNFSYTAPATGKVVYIADTSYTPGAAIGFTATHNEQSAEPTTEEPTPAPTTYTITIDGSEAATVEDGETYTFANTGYGYLLSDGSIYKPGATITVTSDVSVTTLTSSNLSVSVLQGNAIRTEAPAGIAYVAQITAPDALYSSESLASGMLMAYSDAVSESSIDDIYVGCEEVSIKNIVNSGWLNNVDGQYRAGITGMATADYVRPFIARAYVQLTYTDGTTSDYIYSAMSHTRTLQSVAAAMVNVGVANEFVTAIADAE